MAIPREHEAAVRALLAQLQAGKSADTLQLTDALLPAIQVPPPVSPPQNPASQTETKNKNRDGEPSFFFDDEEKIYSHPDLAHLMIVYDGQTDKERELCMTQGDNGVGFNKADAPILSDLAEKYQACKYVTRQELATIHRLIKKYHRQWE